MKKRMNTRECNIISRIRSHASENAVVVVVFVTCFRMCADDGDVLVRLLEIFYFEREVGVEGRDMRKSSYLMTKRDSFEDRHPSFVKMYDE